VARQATELPALQERTYGRPLSGSARPGVAPTAPLSLAAVRRHKPRAILQALPVSSSWTFSPEVHDEAELARAPLASIVAQRTNNRASRPSPLALYVADISRRRALRSHRHRPPPLPRAHLHPCRPNRIAACGSRLPRRESLMRQDDVAAATLTSAFRLQAKTRVEFAP